MDTLHPKALGARLLYWAPVWMPALVCLQLGTRGLAPELAESRRLAQEERDMRARVETHAAERARMEADLLKLTDPVYRERVRRSQGIAGSPPLTLERAHVGTLAPR